MVGRCLDAVVRPRRGQGLSLRYIFRDNVVDKDSKHVMDVPNDSLKTGTLDAPWPGKTFSIVEGDLEGFALLGTPHGNGISWFLIDRPPGGSGQEE
jgi:hypothetical protein